MGTSLAVQWLRLTWLPSLVEQLRPYMPCGKKKKRVMEGLWKPLREKCSTISFLLKSCQVDFTVKRS